MTENGPGENSNDNQPPTERGVPTESDAQHQTVTLSDVLAVQEGDAIAVRVVQESTEWILAGQVTSFAALQEMVSYKAAWDGIPSDEVDPEYTSQRCPRTECQHTERGNRHKKRFKCRQCGFQDHADRKAAVCVVQNWFDEQYGTVPSLETLPRMKKVRRAASGRGGATDSHGFSDSGVDRHGTSARDFQSQAREELKSVASAAQD